MRLSPFSVIEYSTFGGIDGYSLRFINPSVSNIFNVELNTFGDISGNVCSISLKRIQRTSPSIDNISNPHFVLKWEITFRTGQCPISEYFFSISCIFFTLILNIDNHKVTEYHIRNLL